jgi:pyruvate/2-oxoglutarate dehydrogenase complex dihydrolipoamide dehydrogenase (E3) component
MQTNKYDIIIIGAGSGGLNVAGFFSRLKLKVLLIDKSDNHIGGDCLNSGCVPSKALIHIANQVHEARLSKRFYKNNENLVSDILDINKVTNYIKDKQDFIREEENPDYLKNKGIDYVSGTAKFLDSNSVSVLDTDGITTKYQAKNVVLSTGSRPRKLNIENDKSVDEYNNENIFEIKNLPKEFVFIGGGPINCELGQAFSRLGSKVTILNTGNRILEKESVEASNILEKQFIDEGIKIINNIKIEKIENKKAFYTINSTSNSIICDAVFVGIGRELNIENLDLEKADIKLNENKTKLIVDEYLRTSNKNIYAVGDVAGNYQFTHAAEMHAKTIIKNLLSPFKTKFDASNIAWVTYTTPEIATFGVDEKLAVENKLDIIQKTFNHDDRAIVDENQNGLMRLFINKEGEIKGGSVIAKNAGEISQELVLAMSNNINLGKIFNKVYPYPTASRVNKQLAGEWVSKKLTPKNISILRLLYNMFG